LLSVIFNLTFNDLNNNYSYEIAELLPDVAFHIVELNNEFFVARNPMNDWVCQILKIFGLVLAIFNFFFGLPLKIKSEVSAALNAFPAKFEARINLSDAPFVAVKAVHAASGGLIVHDVEFFVQKSVELYLSVPHSLVQIVRHLLVHVVKSIFVL